MSVERENAVVNNTIILRNKFQFAQTADYFDPSAIAKVEILDSNGTTILETITGANIVKDSTGQYHVVATAIATAKTIYDKWYFTPATGAVAITKTNTCVIWSMATGGGATITVGTNSWISEADAALYFAGRLSSDAWDDATTANKVKALITAYRQLIACGLFTLPSEIADITEAVKDAQCEQALFLLQQGADIDSRKGLQAQGVVSSGIVQETYDKGAADGIPIAPNVLGLLADVNISSPIHIVTLQRDQEEDEEDAS